jgi:hypothetical protein
MSIINVYILVFALLIVSIYSYDESEALRNVAISGLTYCSSDKIENKDSFHADAIPEVQIGEVWTNSSSLLFYTAYDR